VHWQNLTAFPILPWRRRIGMPNKRSTPARRGMTMTTSKTFTIHAMCSTVVTCMRISKRWQGSCRSKRMWS